MEVIEQSIIHAEAALPLRQGRVARLLGRMASRGSGLVDFKIPQTFIPTPSEVGQNYDNEVTAWGQTLEAEVADLRGQLATNSERARSLWALPPDASKEERKRHGSELGLRANENRLVNLLDHRSEQLGAAQSGSILEFADEVDPSIFERFIGRPKDLPPNFGLPYNEHPTTDPAKAVELLNTLPFVNYDDVINPKFRLHPGITIKGLFDFPAERIIGVKSFESWAGRGEPLKPGNAKSPMIPNGKGAKSVIPRRSKSVEQTSRGAIVEYAQDKYDTDVNYDQSTVIMFKDSAGEYWGITHGAGSHRAAAAKLRGESTIKVGAIEIASDEDMPRLNYSVREMAAQKAKTSS